jgi:2-dehydro-3-deoxygluconokinase
MRARFDVVALGEALIEFNHTRGSPNQYLQGFGGDTSNCAIAASRLGARVAYVTRVGGDAFGRMLVDLWRHERVDTSGVAVDGDAHTGVYFVTHGERGHEFNYLRAGSAASRMRASELPMAVVGSAQVLHVSGISQAISAGACDSVFAAIGAARNAGAKISFDSNLRLKLWPLSRARAVITATIGVCDWFLPSLDEAAQLSGHTEPQAILDWSHAHGASLVALKMGGDGVWISTTGFRERIPAHRIDVVDATGAGDCFDGALLTRLSAGDAPVDAARYANAAAALATTGYGAVAPLPTDEAVRAFLKRNP